MKSKKRILTLDGLAGKEYITFFSEGGRFDFKNSGVMVEVRFDNPAGSIVKFSADGWVTGQKNTNVMKVRIPKDTDMARVQLSVAWGGENLAEINVSCEPQLLSVM